MTDYCSANGCRVLGNMIQEYWRRLGHNTVKLYFIPEYVKDPKATKATYYCIRSNMTNGLPANATDRTRDQIKAQNKERARR